MSNKLQEVDLLSLVRSLDRREADRLRKHLTDLGNKGKPEIKGLDLLRSTRVPDFSSIKDTLEQVSGIGFRSIKSRLTQTIEAQMQEDEFAASTADVVSANALTMASAYWKKGFTEEAISILRSGIDELVIEDHPEHVLTLLSAELRMIRSSDRRLREERHANYRSQRDAALKIMKNRDDINDLSEEAYQLRRVYYAATHPEIESQVKAIINHPLLKNEISALSFVARIRFHVTLGFCYTMLNDAERTLHHHRMIVEIWEARPDQRNHKPRTYQQAIVNYISECVRNNRQDLVEPLFDKARKILIKDKGDAAAGFCSLSNFWLFYLLNHGDLYSAHDFALSVENGIKSHSEYLKEAELKGLRYNLGTLMFLSDNPKEAIRLYRLVATKKASTERIDLQGVARMMIMLLSYDRDSSLYIDSLNKEARRYFKKNPEVDSLNGLVFEFIGKLLSSTTANEHKTLDQFLSRLESLNKPSLKIAGFEEVKVWVTGRLQNKSYGEVWGNLRGKK